MKNRGLDIALSIFFTLVSVVVAIGLGAIAVMLAMMTDACSEATCNVVVVTIGYELAVWGPGIITLVFVVLTIVASARRRSAWWRPLLGMLLSSLTVAAGAMIIAFAVQGSLSA